MHLPIRIVTGEEYNYQAVAALCALGAEAKPLIPVLVDSLDQLGPFPTLTAIGWMGTLGTEAEAANAALIRVLNGTNAQLRMVAIDTLSVIGAKRIGLVLPVLEQCLNDPDPIIRSHATNAFSRDPWFQLNDTVPPGHSKRRGVPYAPAPEDPG
jgi:hypothetical protein